MANNLNLSLPSICRMGPQKPVGHTIQANPNGAFKFEIDQRRSMVLDKLHILLNGDLRDRQQGNVGRVYTTNTLISPSSPIELKQTKEVY